MADSEVCYDSEKLLVEYSPVFEGYFLRINSDPKHFICQELVSCALDYSESSVLERILDLRDTIPIKDLGEKKISFSEIYNTFKEIKEHRLGQFAISRVNK